MKYNPEIHHRRSVRLKGYDYAQEGMYFVTICTLNRIHFFGEVEEGNMVLNPFGEIACQEWEKLPQRWPHIELGAFQIMPNHMHGVLVIHWPLSVDVGMESLRDMMDVNGAVEELTTDLTTRDRATALSGATVLSGATTRVAPTPNLGIDPEKHDNGTVGATLVVAPDNAVARSVVAPNNTVAPNPLDSSFPPPEAPFSKIQWATRPYLGQVIGAYKSIVSTSCLNYHKENQPGVWLDKIWQRSFDDRIIRDASAFENISNYIINNPTNWKADKFFD